MTGEKYYFCNSRFKAQIQNGTYNVDNASFAAKLLQKYEEMR